MGNLVIKWGRGDGVLALYNGDRVGVCSGGGYDKKGTVVGQFIKGMFQDRLKILLAPDIEEMKKKPFEVDSENRNKIVYYRGFRGSKWYGVYISEYKTVIKKTGEEKSEIKIGLDGATGFNCMENIARAIGVIFHYAGGTSRVDTYYIEIEDYPNLDF